MSVDGKPRHNLNELDQQLKRAFPAEGFSDNRTMITIQMTTGFEDFNTRPYHNYETWSTGYWATVHGNDGAPDKKVSAEDLDVLVERIIKVRKESDGETSATRQEHDSTDIGQVHTP